MNDWWNSDGLMVFAVLFWLALIVGLIMDMR